VVKCKKIRKDVFILICDKFMYYNLVIFALASNISTGITSVCIVLAVLIMLVQKIKMGQVPNFDKQMLKILAIYILLQIVIAVFSINPAESFGDVWGTTYRFLPLFLAMGYLKNMNQIKTILIVFMLSVFITDIVGMYQFLVLENHRPKGMSGTATFYASNLLMALPILYMVYRNKILKLRLISFPLMMFTLIMLILSYTRGGWIALAVMILVLIFMDRNYSKAIIVMCIFLGVLCNVFVLNNSELQNRIISITDIQYRTNTERLLMYESAVEIFKDYPVHGIGQDQFGYMYNTQYISPLAKERSDDDYTKGHGHPHNNFFKYLSEGGILGILAFFLLHGYFLYRMVKLYILEHNVCHISYGMIGLLIIVGIHIEGLTDTNVNQVPIMREYWFLMGLLLTAGKLQLKDNIL